MKARIVVVLAVLGLMATGVTTGTAILLLSTRSLPDLFHSPGHPWLVFGNAAADSLIALAYIAIFLSLFWLGDRLRRLPSIRRHMWVCASFGVFILACGATHAMQSLVLWLPFYGLSLAVKLFSAAAAIVAACLLVSRISKLARSIKRLFDLHASEQRQAEALRKSESLLDRTNRVAGIGGWELDLTTNLVDWSAETARLHGMPPTFRPTIEEGISFFAPEFRDDVVAALQKSMAGGDPWDMEVQILRHDGTRIWVCIRGEVELADGKPVRLFGSFQDKTKEVEQRLALRKSEVLLERTNRVAGIGGWEFDLLTRELFWSDQTARIHGMPPGHKPSYEESFTFFPAEYHPAVTAAVEGALATGEGYELELPLLRADGRRIWVRLMGEVESVDGKPVRLFGSMQDKTEEVERREALRKSEYLLERANRIACMGAWEVDLLTSEVCWSAEIARMHGLPPGYTPTIDEAIGFFTPDSQTQIHEAIHTAVSGGGGWDVELFLLRVDGQRRCVRHLGEVELLDGLPVKLFGSLQDITADFERREALRTSQNFLDRTNRIAGVGGWEIDIPTGVVTWSDETYRIHGLPLTYKPTLEAGLSFYAENSRPIITAAVQHAFDTGEGWDLETEFIRADDKPIWVRTVGNVETIDGKPQRLSGAIQDKTVQVNARLELTRANKRAALATDSCGIAVWDWDLATNQFICDQWMFRIYGLEPKDEPTDLSLWVEHIHPEDRPLVMSAIKDAIEGIKPYDMDFRILWADGTTRIVKATGQVIRDEKGRALHLIGTNCDVTESHRLAAELAQQHELLRVTLLSIGDAVVSTDIDRQIVWMNAAAERMTGWDACDATGKPVSDVFNIVYEATRLPADVYTNPEVARARRIAMDEKVVLVSRENVERNIETCATPIYDDRAQLFGSVLVIRDVTEQFKLARETEQIGKLQTDLKLKDEFLSHVSHELRSPLTSVYSFTSIVADNLAGETTPEQQEYLQIVLKNVLQLQSMIEDLLTVTQSKEGKLPIEVQAVSVAGAILDATNTAHPAAVAKRISITAMDTSNLPEVAADPTRLRQIMIILLDNAIKFAPEEGHIDIRVVEESTMLRFEVEDNGCGIPLDKRARIFEKLYQITAAGHADTSQQGRIGLGLGLHIARDLVRRQGGNIWVSGDPKQGSIFNFTLPMALEAVQLAGNPFNRDADWPESLANQLNPAA